MSDILYTTADGVFSYRVAGICIQSGRVLLQKPADDDGFAFPGGHVLFGETNEESLVREFREETGAHVSVGDLKWIGELFFTWDGRPCHQICLYYQAEFQGSSLHQERFFLSREHLEGPHFTMEFHWIPLDDVRKIKLYPPNTAPLLYEPGEGVRHFVYRE